MRIDPIRFSWDWEHAWNTHDIEAVLAHFSDEVFFTSPMLAEFFPESGGAVRGKAGLRDYWEVALQWIPDLHFTVVGVYAGIDIVVINYRNQKRVLVNEVLRFRAGLVVVIRDPAGSGRRQLASRPCPYPTRTGACASQPRCHWSAVDRRAGWGGIREKQRLPWCAPSWSSSSCVLPLLSALFIYECRSST